MANASDTGTLSYAQLKGVWLNASQGTSYHTNAWASLMAAIAEAESSGDPLATNPTDNNGTQTSWGLWQISNGTHSAPSPNWADPSVNAQLAIGKLNSQGLGAWGTYDSGAYHAYLSDKTAADTAALTTSPDSVTQSAATAAAEADLSCAWKIGLGSLDPSILGYHPVGNISFGNICILSKSQARAVIGAALLGAGILIGAGAVVLVAKAAGLEVLMKLAAPAAGAAGGLGGKTAGVAAAAEAAAV
jgi:Lysozyme like domain